MPVKAWIKNRKGDERRKVRHKEKADGLLVA
jgi:hypothetical protein